MSNPTFRSFQEFEEALRQEAVPYPGANSIRERLLNPEHAAKTIRTKKQRLGLKPLPAIIAILCIGVILFAAGPTVQALFAKYVLHNSSGETVLEYAQMSQEWVVKDAKVRSIMYDWKPKMAEIENSLSAGEAVIFIVPEAYAVGGYYYPLQRTDDYHNIENMIKDTSNGFIAPSFIPEGYHFSEGRIRFETEPVKQEVLEQWYQEALAAKAPYIIKPVKLTGRPQSIDMYYENAGDPIQPRIALYISEATGFSSTSRMAPKTEVIQAAQSEVLYEEEHMHVTLVVPHHNNNLQYTIAGNSFTSKEDLLRIAEGILAASEPQASTSQ